jgi:hypothetical protein
MKERKWQNYFKVTKPYQEIMANNKKGIMELSNHFLKSGLHVCLPVSSDCPTK